VKGFIGFHPFVKKGRLAIFTVRWNEWFLLGVDLALALKKWSGGGRVELTNEGDTTAEKVVNIHGLRIQTPNV
jgi:hypothetical protein